MSIENAFAKQGVWGSFVQYKHWIPSTLFLENFDISPQEIKNKFLTHLRELGVNLDYLFLGQGVALRSMSGEMA